MKFGRRSRRRDDRAEQPRSESQPPERVTDSWTVPGRVPAPGGFPASEAHAPPGAAGGRLPPEAPAPGEASGSGAAAGGGREPDAPAPGYDAGADAPPPAPSEEPIVDADAVELPLEEEAPPFERPVPAAAPDAAPAAAAVGEPVAVVSGEPEAPARAAAVTPLAEAASDATGHGAGALAASDWREPLERLADERPEAVVGAAFAGGLLAAMILRRLGN